MLCSSYTVALSCFLKLNAQISQLLWFVVGNVRPNTISYVTVQHFRKIAPHSPISRIFEIETPIIQQIIIFVHIISFAQQQQQQRPKKLQQCTNETRFERKRETRVREEE